MAARDAERLALAEAMRRALAVENRLSVAQARSFVRCLQISWQVPPIGWGDQESRQQLDDARRLLHAAEIFHQVEGEQSPNAVSCYRRAGELLEWLSRALDPLGTVAPIALFAAAAFQLGGLSAMAASLLARMPEEQFGPRLYADFLRADFDAVLRSTTQFWRENSDLTGRDASTQVLGGNDPDRLVWNMTVELVRSLGLAADSLRAGVDARLDQSLAKLDALERWATRMLSDDASLLITLMRDVARSFSKASIYRPIRRLAELNPAREPRLFRFARGQYSRGRGILWTSQQRGLDRLLADSSFALCTPTGSGKTLVANLALIKELLLTDVAGLPPLALYLVPSRALAGEVEAKLQNELGDDMIITGLYGGTDWGITDYWIEADQPTVLIATVEKADALMRYLGSLLLARLRLLIIDEAHQVVPENSQTTRNSFAEHSNRAIRLEGFVSRLLARKPDVVRIALTAVAGGAARPVARWMAGGNDAEAVGTNYRSTRQVIGVFETRPQQSGVILLDIMNGRPLYVRGRDEPVYIKLRTPAMPQLPATMRNSIYRFNEVTVLWTALHLANDQRRVLISVAQEPEQTMRWYREALDLSDWANLEPFELPDSDPDKARFEETRAACIDYCGADSHELALLDRGIATNHGQMPQRLRRLMTDLIDRRICPITLATATLTEGVNLPFDIIFVTALKRRSFDAETGRPVLAPLSTAEFRNLAGRAGRPGATNGIEGMTLVALPQAISSTAASQRTIQRRQRGELQLDYDQIREALLAEESASDRAESPLALLLRTIARLLSDLNGPGHEPLLSWLEHATPGDISIDAGKAMPTPSARLADSLDELDSVLMSAIEELAQIEDRTLGGADAEALIVDVWQRSFTRVAAVQEAWLEQAFVKRGRAVVDTVYPNPDERKRLYRYGFTPHVGRRFGQIEGDVRALIAEAAGYGAAEANERLKTFVDIGDLLSGDRGFGFRVRQTATDRALLANWNNVLGWWMQGPNAETPQPDDLRAWQRFVADNLEYRLGVAIGAVVAQAWAEGAGNLAVPSLETWRETSHLPWFGFWARELLRWGTLEPFVAFVLAQGLARTRNEGVGRKPEFETWLAAQRAEITPEDRIDPRLYLEWHRGLPHREVSPADQTGEAADLTGTDGRREHYRVIPMRMDSTIRWMDAAGYELARSEAVSTLNDADIADDFALDIAGQDAHVVRAYSRGRAIR
jgi:hypothetical protein